jgi:hypothetical protein
MIVFPRFESEVVAAKARRHGDKAREVAFRQCVAALIASPSIPATLI